MTRSSMRRARDIQSIRFLGLAVLVATGLCVAGCQRLPKDQAHFQKGYDAYKEGDFYSALLFLKPLVEQGHPAAQLLMAKMYSAGQGVEEDEGKAELLRNLAALKVYNKLPPGAVRPANQTLATISKRIDYLENPATPSREPMKDLSQLLGSLDLGAIKQIAAATGEELGDVGGPAAGEAATTPFPILPQDIPTLPSASKRAPGVTETPQPEVATVPTADARKANRISLGLIRQAAERGDAFAMELLASAYQRGFYGLPVDATQAASWSVRAEEARRRGPSSALREKDAGERIPYVPLAVISIFGVGLIGLGVWRYVKPVRHRKPLPRH